MSAVLPIRPLDLPMLRDEAAEEVLHLGPELYELAIRNGIQLYYPHGMSPTKAANIMVGAEVARLKAADLFFVSQPMTDLAVAAAKGLPDFNLMPEDLPSPSGLIVFGSPVAEVDYSEWKPGAGFASIVAASWSHWSEIPEWKHGGVWITWYGDRDRNIHVSVARGLVGAADAERFRKRHTARLNIDNESPCPFSPDPVTIMGWDFHEKVATPSDTHIGNWLPILKATWLLMSQPIGQVTEAEFPRAMRRRAEREQREPPRVRVITLRNMRHDDGAGSADREYHHQWIVRGHWRQQWYPSREVHRPVWIAPHLKGPEGLPLLGGEKVYAWTR